MSELRFPLVEYEAEPELPPHSPNQFVWQTRLTIDLRWVMSACPYTDEGVIVDLCGRNRSFIIRAHYDDFKCDWARAVGEAVR